MTDPSNSRLLHLLKLTLVCIPDFLKKLESKKKGSTFIISSIILSYTQKVMLCHIYKYF